MVLDSSSDEFSRAARVPSWTPCSTDPEFFDCRDCEIGWSPCRLRLDESLRHWRAARYSRRSGPLSENDERDNAIESEIIRLLLSHGISVNADLLLEYVPRGILDGITEDELENLLRKSPKFLESSPRMFKLKGSIGEESSIGSFLPLPITSGTQLASLIDDSPTLGAPRQTQLFKKFGGLNLLSSFETKQNARVTLDKIANQCLETVQKKRGWTIQTVHMFAVGPDSVPNSKSLTDEDVLVTSRLLSAVAAGELLTRMSPADACRLVLEIKQTLILGNLKLVARVARIRANGGFLTFADLLQIGTIGLMTAIERFDPFRGFQFSTYATYWIRQAIGRDQANLNRCIRLPVHVVEGLNSLLKRRQEFEADLNRLPTNAELAGELKLGHDRVEVLLQLERPPESLDLMLEYGAGALENELTDLDSANVGDPIDLLNWVFKDAVEKMLVSLSSREAQVLKLRFGIDVDHAQTLEQVGQHFGLTRERIRQIEKEALKKLQRPEYEHQMRDLL